MLQVLSCFDGLLRLLGVVVVEVMFAVNLYATLLSVIDVLAKTRNTTRQPEQLENLFFRNLRQLLSLTYI